VGDIAPTKAMTKAMTKVAKHSGLSRASLYEALSGKRRPSFATILKGVSALGLRAISSA
jgi:probable addiction module antidote protein